MTAPSLALPEGWRDEVAAGLDACRGRGATVAVAESCTGGLLGAALTAVPGSSQVVVGGVIAYADRVKLAQLGVDPQLLRSAGAVSLAVARAMAAGVAARLGATIGVGITGVAGPAGSEGRPPGLVHLAAVAPWGERHARHEQDLGRAAIRGAAVLAALRLLRELAEARG
ncbi:MAG TPA: CinA family protein [Verrucomicrobiae bacterium]|nr:CinA family protein [Verrucomicrobiae bacterium]